MAKGHDRSWTGQKNLLLTAWDFLFPVAVRASQHYLLHWLEQQYSMEDSGPHRYRVIGPGGERLMGQSGVVGD